MAAGKKLGNIPKPSCMRPRKSIPRQKMTVAVFEVMEERPKPMRHTTNIGSAHGVPIRVCKGRLSNACNPGVCDCPDELCRLKKTKMQILMQLIKYAIFGYAVGEAVRYGIWSDASKTDALTERYLAWARDFFPTINKTKRTPQEVYDMDRIRYNLKNVWNNLILGITGFVASVPEKVGSYIFPAPPEPPAQIQGGCELNLGIRDEDDY